MSLTSEDVIWHWLREGWKYRGFNKKPAKYRREASARVKHEMKMIADKDFVDYFLVMSDVVRHVKDAGLPVGPARGSAAASLVCYLIRITEVNPMDFPLMLFERFIDPNRYDIPDIDLDFDDERRDEVRQYMISKYGENRVGNIGTFTRFRGKNSIDDICRVYQLPRDAESVKDFLIERSGGDARFDASIEDTVEFFPQVKATFDRYPQLYLAMQLEGNYKTFGVHAAGLVIGAEDLNNYVATYTKKNVGGEHKTLKVLSVDKYDGEPLGLMKLDALGLQTMGMIRHAIETAGMTLDDLYNLPLDDIETMEAFRRADVAGIFQFDGSAMRGLCVEMEPITFMDLAAVNALARPGPLHSGTAADYVEIRKGQRTKESFHPLLDKITADTEGQIIYQEQILQICRQIGNFSWTHAGEIRKIISNKKGESAFNALWDRFLEGATSNGVPEKAAREIWKRMATAGVYAFNIAHSVSYSILGYWCMYLKVHHPVAFYAAQLQKVTVDPKKRKDIELMKDCEAHGIKVFPPDLNTSGLTWSADVKGKRVVAGFTQIKGIGESYAKAIIARREDLESGEFEGWEDLLDVRGIGPAKLKKIMEFTEKEDPFGIYELERQEMAIRRSIQRGELPCAIPNTYSDKIPYEAKRSFHVVAGIVMRRNLKDLFETHRSRTGEELDPETVRRPDLKDNMTLYVRDRHGDMTIRINRFIYPEYKTVLWSARPGIDWIVARVEKMAFSGKVVHVKKMWIINPEDD